MAKWMRPDGEHLADDRPIRRRSSRRAGTGAGDVDHERQADEIAASLRASGQHRADDLDDGAIPAAVRGPIEEWAGVDLSAVTLRDAPLRPDSLAWTDGTEVAVPAWLRASDLGEHVLRHELVHAAQQRAGPGPALPAKRGVASVLRLREQEGAARPAPDRAEDVGAEAARRRSDRRSRRHRHPHQVPGARAGRSRHDRRRLPFPRGRQVRCAAPARGAVAGRAGEVGARDQGPARPVADAGDVGGRRVDDRSTGRPAGLVHARPGGGRGDAPGDRGGQEEGSAGAEVGHTDPGRSGPREADRGRVGVQADEVPLEQADGTPAHVVGGARRRRRSPASSRSPPGRPRISVSRRPTSPSTRRGSTGSRTTCSRCPAVRTRWA